MKNTPIEFWKTGENPITCYASKPFISESKKTTVKIVATNKRKVTVIDLKKIVYEYESIAEAAAALVLKPHNLYAFLNGRAKNPTNLVIF